VLFVHELTPAASFLTMAALEEHGDAKCGRRPDRAGGRPPSTCAREDADIVSVARCDVRRRRREGDSMVRGVRFLVDETGRETAVQIDLKSQARLCEDFYDRALAEKRASEPRESLRVVKQRVLGRRRRRG
jgi:hypothetical protein